jgi:hypothetical protein
MAEQDVTKPHRLDHDLYVAEGVVVLGAAIFLVGFAIEKNSTTDGRVLEAAGFVVFALGLFGTAAIGHLLSRHFARTAAAPLLRVTDTPSVDDVVESARLPLTYLASRVHEGVSDPAEPLMRDVSADPEDDASKARLIERERRGAQSAGYDRFGDQQFNE